MFLIDVGNKRLLIYKNNIPSYLDIHKKATYKILGLLAYLKTTIKMVSDSWLDG